MECEIQITFVGILPQASFELMVCDMLLAGGRCGLMFAVSFWHARRLPPSLSS
jgi:hypothetical protein